MSEDDLRRLYILFLFFIKLIFAVLLLLAFYTEGEIEYTENYNFQLFCLKIIIIIGFCIEECM